MTKRINWNNILQQVGVLKERLVDQNFCIDLAHNILSSMSPNLQHRPEINSPAISAYWSREFLEQHKLNSFPIDPNSIYIELEYYSYLNISEIRDTAYSLGTSIYIIDLISDTTDAKSGMLIDDWLDENEEFQYAMQDLWNDELSSIWQSEGKLITKKNTVNYSHYWKNEQYIYQLRIYDGGGRPILVALLGTYLDYT
jgi:hypothetical protein